MKQLIVVSYPKNGSDIPDHHKTLFLVLHHQSEKCIGVKYIRIVEKYYSK